MSYKKIDFVVAGFPKSGTTALANFLSEHPEICMASPKEPGYFATDLMRESDEFHGKHTYFLVRTPEEYNKYFKHCSPDQILGEATISYVYSQEAAQKIYEHNPGAKIIIMLRNPVDFIYSLHMQLINSGMETETDFKQALELESRRKKGFDIPQNSKYPSTFLYKERTKYYTQVKRYFDIFPPENILVFTNEEFSKDNVTVFKKVSEFLGVDASFTPEFRIVHGSKTPRFKHINRLVQKPKVKNAVYAVFTPSLYNKVTEIGRKVVLKKQPRQSIDPELKNRLEKEFVSEAQKTGELLNRDLVKEWGLDE